MAGSRDPYEVLGVARGAGAAEVKAAWRRRARECHPDAGGDAEEFVAVQEAYATLSDPLARAEADARAAGAAAWTGRAQARAGSWGTRAGAGDGPACAPDADPLPWDEMLDGLGGWPAAPSFERDATATPTFVTLRVTPEEAASGFRKRVGADVAGRPARVRVEVAQDGPREPGYDLVYPGMGHATASGFADLVVRVRLSRRGRARAHGGV